MGFEPQTFRPTVRRTNHCATGAGCMDTFVHLLSTRIPLMICNTHINSKNTFIHPLHPHRYLHLFTTPNKIPSFIHYTQIHFLFTTPTQIPLFTHYTHKYLHSFTTPTQIPSFIHYTHTDTFIHYTHTNTSIHSLHPHRYLYSFTTPTHIPLFIHYTHTNTPHTHKYHYLFTTPTQIPLLIHNTTKQTYWQAKLPSRMALHGEWCWEAWDTTCGHKSQGHYTSNHLKERHRKRKCSAIFLEMMRKDNCHTDQDQNSFKSNAREFSERQGKSVTGFLIQHVGTVLNGTDHWQHLRRYFLPVPFMTSGQGLGHYCHLFSAWQ